MIESPGVPFEPQIRTFFEERFGRNFSHVRVHLDGRAAESAAAVGAAAYTVGSHISFGTGRYSPSTSAGRGLIAHELTHVVQQGSSELAVQRSLQGCAELMKTPSILSLISGVVVHKLIADDFNAKTAGAKPGMAIPGASAGALRSEAICGGSSKIIPPQSVGGRAGAGFPDLARVTPGGILQVAEIKPGAAPCLIDGEEQVLRYIDQGNARDPEQIAWRAAAGVKVVSPMPESAYSPPELATDVVQIKTAWCAPGLLAYQVSARGQPVPVVKPETAEEKKKKEKESEKPKAQPAPLGEPVPVLTRGQAIRLIVDFVKTMVETKVKDIDTAVTKFLHDNPALSAFIITAGVAAIIALVADDLTLVGIADDVAIPPIVLALWRAATAL